MSASILLRTICSWCGGLIADGPLTPEGLCSHGICEACTATFRVKAKP
jgi:hypothetical protein